MQTGELRSKAARFATQLAKPTRSLARAPHRTLDAPDRTQVPMGPSPVARTQPAIGYGIVCVDARIDTVGTKLEVQRLDNDEIQRLIAREERSERSDATVASGLADAAPGSVARVPLAMIRPGQSQLSFDRAREKMLSLLDRIDGRVAGELLERANGAIALNEADFYSAVIGPEGRYVVLVDGHHKMAATKALEALVNQLVGRARRGALLPKLGQDALAVSALFGRPARAPVCVRANLSHLSEEQFWETLKTGQADAPLFLEQRKAEPLLAPPTRFSELSDNPFRALAGHTAAKLKLTRDGKKRYKLRGAERPIWIKGPGALPFTEFHVAKVYETALSAAGIRYRSGARLDGKTRAVLRSALIDASVNPSHPAHKSLAGLVVLPREVSLSELPELILVGRKRGTIQLKKKLRRALRRAA